MKWVSFHSFFNLELDGRKPKNMIIHYKLLIKDQNNLNNIQMNKFRAAELEESNQK